MRNSRRTGWTILLLTLVCGLLGIALFSYLNYAANQAVESRPWVVIRDTFPQENELAAGQPVVVFGHAEDPDGIQHIELWVNGQKIAEQSGVDESAPLQLDSSQSWVPTSAGRYLVFLRALNTNGVTGDSDPRIVLVGERTPGGNPNATTQYIVQEGDTVEGIAQDLGFSPDEILAGNPEIGEVTPGTSLILPPIPGAGPEPSFPEGEALPRVDPASSSPASGDETPASPSGTHFLFFFPLPDNFYCLIYPSFCGTPSDSDPPPAADQVAAVNDGVCRVTVTWRDNSENEVGFLVYRMTTRPYIRQDLVQTLEAVPGNSTRLSYVDNRPPNGEFYYSVVVYNSAGDVWSAPSEPVMVGCLADDGSIVTLRIEALDITLNGIYDRLYCFVSLDGGPFERVPSSPTEFIRFDGRAWDIAAHMSGASMRTISISPDAALALDVECLGWQGGDLIPLGRFQREHASEDWNGSRLSSGPDGGGFTVGYRINRTDRGIPDETGTLMFPIIDYRVPAPYNLRAGNFGVLMAAEVPGNPGVVAQTLVPQLAIAWNFNRLPGVPTPLRFNVYRMAGGFSAYLVTGEERWENYYSTPTGDALTAPQVPDCSRWVSYMVNAVVDIDPLTGEEITSPMSEVLSIPPSCIILEITLTSIESFIQSDTSSYGWFEINSKRLIWNRHCDGGIGGGGCLSSGPSTTYFPAESILAGSGLSMRSSDHPFYRDHNNILRIPIHDGDDVLLYFQIMNHRDILDDNGWCSQDHPRILPARSLEEWSELEPGVASFQSGNCRLRFNYRVLPAP